MIASVRVLDPRMPRITAFRDIALSAILCSQDQDGRRQAGRLGGTRTGPTSPGVRRHRASWEMPMSMEQAKGNDWAILNVDPLTGDLIDGEERAYRERIRQEADQGLVGVDAFYFSVKRVIHQPLIGEHGAVAEDAWQFERANKIVLHVPIGDDPATGTIQEAAVNIARTALDDFAAEVMEMLFGIANDPPIGGGASSPCISPASWIASASNATAAVSIARTRGGSSPPPCRACISPMWAYSARAADAAAPSASLPR